MARDKKTRLLTVRISPTEHALLEELADADGLPMATVLRLFIRREHAKRFGEQKTASRSRRKRK